MSGKSVALLLACFSGPREARKARHGIESGIGDAGGTVLETTILRVGKKQKASVWDPRRDLLGVLAPAITWGLFGLVAGTNKLLSLVVWAVLGAICGALYAYLAEHILTKAELTRIGRGLPADSSALATFADTNDPESLVRAASTHGSAIASAAAINADLEAHVLSGESSPAAGSNELLSMILLRYPDPNAAKSALGRLPDKKAKNGKSVQVELAIRTDASGRRHVADPTHGVEAMSKSDVISWGGFGLVFGVIAGALGGGGILGFLEDGLVTAIAWGIFGMAAGALYGLWAGRSISARRLRGVGGLLPPSSSMLVAWAGGPVTAEMVEPLATQGSRHLALAFSAVERGAILEADNWAKS
jgi:hypothetical protein